MFKISLVLWGNSEQCWNAGPLRKMESCERRPEAKAVTECHMNAMQSTLGGQSTQDASMQVLKSTQGASAAERCIIQLDWPVQMHLGLVEAHTWRD